MPKISNKVFAKLSAANAPNLAESPCIKQDSNRVPSVASADCCSTSQTLFEPEYGFHRVDLMYHREACALPCTVSCGVRTRAVQKTNIISCWCSRSNPVSSNQLSNSARLPNITTKVPNLTCCCRGINISASLTSPRFTLVQKVAMLNKPDCCL